LRVIHAYIASDNPQAAKYVVQGIREAVNRLSQFPDSGRPGKVAGTRELVLPQWPYIVVYRVISDEVHILRAFHAATDWWNPRSDLGTKPGESEDIDA
jgi:plasmid stabilization system protein ParE